MKIVKSKIVKSLAVAAGIGVCGGVAATKVDMSPLASEYHQHNSARPNDLSCKMAELPTALNYAERLIANASDAKWAKRATRKERELCGPVPK